MTLRIDIPEETFRSILAKAFGNTAFVTGFAITVLILAMALISYVWTPYDVTKLVIADKTQGPSLTHWFGTDHFGRDILSMIMVGARNSIAVALVAVGIGMGVGVPLGTFAA
ncbi:MAG: ABC transporter permease, partial [Mesorhizobium sp.]